MQSLKLSELLDERLGYYFKDAGIRKLALTHPSAYNRGEVNTHYERLEFLGDAVLELVVTEYLFEKMPLAPEGLMTQLRARVVGRANLAVLGRELELNQFMILGKGEEMTGGRDRESNIANTFEAVLGAVFLDSDFATAKGVALNLLGGSLESVAEDPREDNPKGELQMELQKRYPESPQYQTEEAPAGSEVKFFSKVVWRGEVLGEGAGDSKRKAEVAAALDSLLRKSWNKIN